MLHATDAPTSAAGFRFEPLRESHLPMLREWLQRPHVARWWGPAESIAELRAAYVSDADAPDATRAYIVHLGEEPIGFVQCYVVMGSGGGWWEDETDPGARGTDQFLADADRLRRGLGSAMLRAFLQQVFADPAVSLVQTDPSPDNERAIRCYQRAGFQRVSEVRTPDGPALLMRCTRASLRAALDAAAPRA